MSSKSHFCKSQLILCTENHHKSDILTIVNIPETFLSMIFNETHAVNKTSITSIIVKSDTRSVSPVYTTMFQE